MKGACRRRSSWARRRSRRSACSWAVCTAPRRPRPTERRAMWVRLEPRKAPSRLVIYAGPVAAIALTMVAGYVLFTLMGYRGGAAVFQIFLQPLIEPAHWPDIAVKASPLVMIATGLAIGFRANVWNIGAEGQYVLGAIAGTGVGL